MSPPWSSVRLAFALLLVTGGGARARFELTDTDSCMSPSIQLTVGVGCDFSGFFTEALAGGLSSTTIRAQYGVRPT
jgi:hypothetical protein